jgi:dihydrodipicolinate synthase/N-acetylneuraminate lyase
MGSLPEMYSEDFKNRLKHTHAFVVTPFDRDDSGRLDVDALVRNVGYLIERGVEVLNVGGGTGEVNALSNAELEALSQATLNIAGSRPLVIPTLPENLGAALELAPVYERMGARVALGMAPYTRNEVPDDLEGVFNHYRTLAGASGLALMPYNTQAWPAGFFLRLAEIDRIVGIKDPCRAPHNLFAAIQILGDRFVWIGNKRHDPGVLHLRFQMGIDGFSAGFVNFAPQFELELFELAREKNWEAMVSLQRRLAPLERLRARYGDVATIKTGMDLAGLHGGPVRPPRVDVPVAGRAEILGALTELGVETTGA